MSTAPVGHCLVRGSINVDEFFHVKDVVRPGETTSSTQFERRAGGKGANQAAAVARAGGTVSLVGAVGEDGIWVTRDLEAMGVDVTNVSVVQEPTGRAVIQLTPTGENCIILHKGANYAFQDPPSAAALASASTTHLLLQNEIPWPSTLAYLTAARAQGITTIFNPSPMPDVDQIRSFPWTHLSWLLVNEGEAESLLTVFPPDAPSSDASFPIPAGWPNHASLASAYAVVRKLAAHPFFSTTTNVICTLGAAGVLAFLPSLSQPIYIPAATLHGDVRDTTGAGDCFTGYLVAGLMQLQAARADARALSDHDIINILTRSAQAAGMCVEKRGALESIPAAADVERRLKSIVT